MFKDHFEWKDRRFNGEISKIPQNAKGQDGSLLCRPDGISDEPCNDQNRNQGGWRIEDPSGNGKIVIQIETGWMRIEKKSEIIKDNPKLGKHPLSQGEISNPISLLNGNEISLSPENQPNQYEQKDRSYEDQQYLSAF
jgi:hypothetical protein